MIEVTRYKRYWAVYRSGQLIAVCVYRKGAENVARLLQKGGPV